MTEKEKMLRGMLYAPAHDEVAKLSEDLGEAMVGINPSEIQIIMEERGR